MHEENEENKMLVLMSPRSCYCVAMPELNGRWETNKPSLRRNISRALPHEHHYYHSRVPAASKINNKSFLHLLPYKHSHNTTALTFRTLDTASPSAYHNKEAPATSTSPPPAGRSVKMSGLNKYTGLPPNLDIIPRDILTKVRDDGYSLGRHGDLHRVSFPSPIEYEGVRVEAWWVVKEPGPNASVCPDGYTLIFTPPVFGHDEKNFPIDIGRAIYHVQGAGIQHGMDIIHGGDVMSGGVRWARWYADLQNPHDETVDTTATRQRAVIAEGFLAKQDGAETMVADDAEEIARGVQESTAPSAVLYLVMEDEEMLFGGVGEDMPEAMEHDEQEQEEGITAGEGVDHDAARGLEEQDDDDDDEELEEEPMEEDEMGDQEEQGEEEQGEEDEGGEEDEDEDEDEEDEEEDGAMAAPAPAIAAATTAVVGSPNDPAKHPFPCPVPNCDEDTNRRMNRRTLVLSHLIQKHGVVGIPVERGGPADKTPYNRRQNKVVREYLTANGWSWRGTIFADGA
ncbi:hypothetical protein LTR27_002727 [Elasticomyces elasticus]|nr:hypothetical protein LTR27_002727 [Elasticomyces elasticus]